MRHPSSASAALISPPDVEPLYELSAPVLPVEHWTEMPLTWLGAALDRAALRGMRLAFADALYPPAAEIAAAEASAAPYMTDELRGEPKRFFAFLDAPPREVEMRELGRRPLAGGEAVTRRFCTQYVPYH